MVIPSVDCKKDVKVSIEGGAFNVTGMYKGKKGSNYEGKLRIEESFKLPKRADHSQTPKLDLQNGRIQFSLPMITA